MRKEPNGTSGADQVCGITLPHRALANVYDCSVGAQNSNPQEELDRLESQIDSITDPGALDAVYARLNEILDASPNDFNLQFRGIETKRRLLEHAALLEPPAGPAVRPPGTTQAVPQTRPEQILPLPTFEPLPPMGAPPPPPAPSFRDDATVALPTMPSAVRPEPPGPPPSPSAIFPPSSSTLASQPPSSPPLAPPTISTVKPPMPPKAPSPPPPPATAPRPAAKRKVSLLALIATAGGLVLIIAIVFLMVTRKREIPAPAVVQVSFSTTPPGATVRVSSAQNANPAVCISNCRLPLAPGAYQIAAELTGFDPVASAVTVVAGQPAAVNLVLPPQAQSVRLLTDLARAKVAVDDEPPTDVQEGQFILDKVAAGSHRVKVTGPSGDASFTFEIADARMPAVTGPVTAHNMVAVLVTSFGRQARVVTNAGPWKLAVNGQPQNDATPAGTDLTSFQPGVNEIVVGKDQDQHNMSETFGAAPMLTAFLKSDVNAGTLIIATGQDDVRVFLNDKEYRRRTQRGQLRVQTLGKVTVRVAKAGFQEEPPQTVEIKKGAEVRVQFTLKQQPQFGSLQITGGMAGAEVLIDQKNVGTIGPDGSLTMSGIQPGEHAIELRREQYLPKRLQRSFRAGQTVALAGAEIALAAAMGSVQITKNPASASVTYRRGEEGESHEVRGNRVELGPGTYTFTAEAPGFSPASIRVQIAAGESHDVDFALARVRTAPPPPSASGMNEFEDAASWKKEGDSWTHKGGGFVPYKLPPKGTFTFTVQLLKGGGVFRAGQIRWCVQYVDSRNYLLYQIDHNTFWAGVIEKGKRLERVKTPHNLGNQKSYTIQIDVAPDRLVQKVRVGNEWKVLDTFNEPGRDFTQGKFGFLIQGNDEIAISDFKFLPSK